MTFTGAVIKEQGQTFAVVLVKRHIVQSPSTANDTINSFSSAFPGMPVVLAAQDLRGRFTYFGRQDISRFLASINARQIPWREYQLN